MFRSSDIEHPCSGADHFRVEIQIIGSIRNQRTIAEGRRIRELRRLLRDYGQGRWRKRKGVARVRLEDATICHAEVHWYEAHGIGRKELKIKRRVGD